MTDAHPTAVVLEARGLHKSYTEDGEKVAAVRDVDLTIGAGDFAALTGPSGSGKSTLLHLLGGLARATLGEVVIGGRLLSTMSDDDLARWRNQQVGFVFQAFNLVPVLTAEENVALPTVIAGRSSAGHRARVRDLLAAVGLDSKRHRRPNQLSIGEQQRVAIARALVMQPGILLADEPTGNLDSASSRRVMAVLREQHDRGQTILIVTHDAKVAAQTERILFMRDGGIVHETRPTGEGEATPVLARIVDFDSE
jgi:putative ABC transport system ATP-binding protein